MMRTPVIYSAILHVVVIVLSVVGLPMISKPLVIEDKPVVVELVTISNETNIATRPKEEPKKQEEPKPEPPKPEPKKVEAPPPSPPKPPPPQQAAVPPPPEPKAEPKPQPKVEEPKPEPKPDPKPQAQAQKAKAKKADESFDSLLQNLSKTLPKKTEEKKPDPKAQQQNFDQMIAKAIPSDKRIIGDPSKPLTMTQKDAIQNEFNKAMQRCWNIPAGAKGVQDMSVHVQLQLAPDGSVTSIRSEDIQSSDPFRRTLAESAVRALRLCSPYSNLAAIASYDQWKDVDSNFNPAGLF
jgi:outer membrane biosynthesis protein TonB